MTVRWYRRFTAATPGSPRLVCFPHAGGAASSFVRLARALAPDADLLAAQYPGRQDRSREDCVENLAELADALTEALRPWLTANTVLFGHSMGAILAFEVARRLERAPGPAPAGVIVSGRHAPSSGRAQQIWTDADLDRELRQLGGTHSDVLADDDLRELALRTLRGDARAVESYTPEPGAAVSCPLAAFTGEADPTTSIEDASAWRNHTTSQFELRVFPGDHFYVQSRLTELTQALRTLLTSEHLSATGNRR